MQHAYRLAALTERNGPKSADASAGASADADAGAGADASAGAGVLIPFMTVTWRRCGNDGINGCGVMRWLWGSTIIMRKGRR